MPKRNKFDFGSFAIIVQFLLSILDPRVLLLVIPAFWYVYTQDAANAMTIAYWTAVAVVLVGVTHLLRKLSFPYFDLKALADKAVNENSVPAAIVVFSVVMFICVILFTLTTWTKP